MAKPSPALPDFETSLGELERIASTMESGQIPLNEALAAYQRGISLLKHCQGTLATAEQQIEVLDQGLMASLTANASTSDTDSD
jgi:exodeoxyribonuclease VII small subunit